MPNKYYSMSINNLESEPKGLELFFFRRSIFARTQIFHVDSKTRTPTLSQVLSWFMHNKTSYSLKWLWARTSTNFITTSPGAWRNTPLTIFGRRWETLAFTWHIFFVWFLDRSGSFSYRWGTAKKQVYQFLLQLDNPLFQVMWRLSISKTHNRACCCNNVLIFTICT